MPEDPCGHAEVRIEPLRQQPSFVGSHHLPCSPACGAAATLGRRFPAVGGG